MVVPCGGIPICEANEDRNSWEERSWRAILLSSRKSSKSISFDVKAADCSIMLDHASLELGRLRSISYAGLSSQRIGLAHL